MYNSLFVPDVMSKFSVPFFLFSCSSLHFTDVIPGLFLLFSSEVWTDVRILLWFNTPDPHVSITVFVISTYTYGVSSTLYVGYGQSTVPLL